MPSLGQRVPSGQGSHSALAFPGWYVPGAQGTGADDPIGQKLPAGQMYPVPSAAPEVRLSASEINADGRAVFEPRRQT